MPRVGARVHQTPAGQAGGPRAQRRTSLRLGQRGDAGLHHQRKGAGNNSKTLSSEFPIPVVDALEVHEATSRVLNRPADAFTHHRVLSSEQRASRELDGGWRGKNDKLKPDWNQDSVDSTPVRARARRQVPAAPQALEEKERKRQQAAAEPAGPSRTGIVMPVTTKAVGGRTRARKTPMNEFKSSFRHPEAMKEWGEVIRESLHTACGAQEGNDDQLAAGLADAAKKLGVRDQVQGTLAKRGRPPHVRAAELLEAQFQMNLSHAQTKQLAT